MSKNYLGIDVHKHRCVFTELDSKGKIIRRGSFINELVEVSAFAASLTGKTHLVLEPVLNYLWLLDHFEPFAGSVHVAVPYKVRVIAESKSKTDKYDSRILAELLRINFLPESWIAPAGLRSLRELIRQRYFIVKGITALKNRIRHLLFSQGLKLRVSDISSVRAVSKISKLCLPRSKSLAIKQSLKFIACYQESLSELEKEIDGASKDVEMIELLKSIPGMGRVWSVIVYAEVGNIERFSSRKAFASYTGLVPSVRASAGSVHHGGITHLGSKPLRHALVEAAIIAIRKVPSLNNMYTRIHYRSNVQKARVAVAHTLALIIYAMLKNKEPFRMEVV